MAYAPLVARSGQWNMSSDVARRLALGAQGFADRAPSGAVDRRHLRRVMGRLKVLQLDSILVVIRTQYLPFHSRLGPYRADLLDRVAYHHDEWFEAWAHEASLLPVAAEPLFRWMKDRVRSGHTTPGRGSRSSPSGRPGTCRVCSRKFGTGVPSLARAT